MAQKHSMQNQSIKLLLACLLGMTLVLVQSINDRKETNLGFYVQQIRSGPNATEIPVAGIQGKAWTLGQFGTIIVVDDAITEGPNLNSTQIGRLEGLLVVASLGGSRVYGTLSIVFTNQAYNSSTLELQGVADASQPVRESAVVSGTGKFRFVSGYGLSSTYFASVDGSYSIVRLNVTLKYQTDS